MDLQLCVGDTERLRVWDFIGRLDVLLFAGDMLCVSETVRFRERENSLFCVSDSERLCERADSLSCVSGNERLREHVNSLFCVSDSERLRERVDIVLWVGEKVAAVLRA